MPAPTSYSESALQAFMVVELGDTATVLGWVPGTPRVLYAVHDAAELLGVADVVTVTDMAALKAVARLSIWRAAWGGLVAKYATTIEGQAMHPEQHFAHARDMIAYYEDECARQGIATASGSGAVSILTVVHSNDPYALPAAAGAEF